MYPWQKSDRAGAAVAGDNEEPERDQVEEWQLEQLDRLGVPLEDAQLLIAAGVSWHRVYELVCRGCDPLVAVRIVT